MGRTHPICRKPFGLDGLISVTLLKPPINRVIYDFKYHWVTELKTVLVNITVSYLYSQGIVFSGFSIIPVPLDKNRERWRGYNQAKLIGTVLAERLHIPYNDTVLFRIKQTHVQADLKTQEERNRNLADAFSCTKESVIGKRLLLIDDVITTGATLRNAAKELKRKGAAEVWGLTVARRS